MRELETFELKNTVDDETDQSLIRSEHGIGRYFGVWGAALSSPPMRLVQKDWTPPRKNRKKSKVRKQIKARRKQRHR